MDGTRPRYQPRRVRVFRRLNAEIAMDETEIAIDETEADGGVHPNPQRERLNLSREQKW